MAVITTAQLAPWVARTPAELDADPLALAVIDRASLLVNDAARATWNLDDPDDRPPEVAVMIAEQLAARTYSNPRVVQQRSTGPMSERLADIVLTGMSLRPDEIDRLREFRTGEEAQVGGRLWVLEIDPVVPDRHLDTVAYIEAYRPHPPGVTYFPSDYDHV